MVARRGQLPRNVSQPEIEEAFKAVWRGIFDMVGTGTSGPITEGTVPVADENGNLIGSSITDDGSVINIANAVNFIKFLQSYVPTGSEPYGTSYWDSGNHTLSTVLERGVIGQHFEEALFPVQNDTGATIENGEVCTYAGSIGNSGNIRVELTVAAADEHPMMTIGIATADIDDGEQCKVTMRGKVRGIQTDGANYGETWNDADILYKSSTIAGGLTNVAPNAPVPAIPMAVVISSHASNGTLLVRPTIPEALTMLSDVNGTALTASGQILVWDHINKYFDFTENINNFAKGPASATDNAFPRYDGTTGKLIQNGQTTEDNSGNVSVIGYITAGGDILTPTGDIVATLGDLYVGGDSILVGSATVSGVLKAPSVLINAISAVGTEKLRVNGSSIFGGATNHTEIEADGTAVAKGDATVWDDITNSLIGARLSSSSGKVDYNYSENTITFQSGGSMATANDRVNWNQQFPHAAKTGSSLYPHIHFEQVGTNKIEFRLDYRIQSNGAAKTTAWTEINCNTDDDSVFTYVSGTLNQIVAFPAIDMTGASISSTVQFRMVREDSTSGDIEVTFVDCHFERDMGGSRTQYTK